MLFFIKSNIGRETMPYIFFVCSLLTAAIINPRIRDMLLQGGIVRKNYKDIEIPVGMGIAIVPVLLVNTTLFFVFYKSSIDILLLFLVGILTMAFAGIIDDLIGNRNATGFKGHFGNLFKGKLTTGGFKACIGGIVGFCISLYISDGFLMVFLNTALILLMTNLLNLFDLRPGRALKLFMMLGLVLFILGMTFESKNIFSIVLGYCIVYLPQDLKGKSMMGDAGSNILGMTLGIISAVSLGLTQKLIALSILFMLNIAAERYSLTDLIKKNYVLNLLDQLGR